MRPTTHKELIKALIAETTDKLSRRLCVSPEYIGAIEFELGCQWLEQKRYADDGDEAKRWQRSPVFWRWWRQQFCTISCNFLQQYTSTTLLPKQLAQILTDKVMKFDKFPPDKVADRI